MYDGAVPFADELGEHLTVRYAARVVILYGSMATGGATAASDADALCFVGDDRRYPEAYTHEGRLMDVWIHPLGDAAATEGFLKVHGGRVLLDADGVGADLMQRVNAYLERPRERLSEQRDAHERAWLWKMFDRAFAGDPESDHRRHWLLCDLPEAWCRLEARHYLGPKKTFQAMKAHAPDTWRLLSCTLRPQASPEDIEKVIFAIAGPRTLTDQSR